MIPFYVEFKPGAPIYEQVVYAAHKSIISGQLRPGENFLPSAPSPNNSNQSQHRHKSSSPVLPTLGLLEIRPGSVAIVAKRFFAVQEVFSRLCGQKTLGDNGDRAGANLEEASVGKTGDYFVGGVGIDF